MSFERGLTIKNALSLVFLSLAQLSYGVQTRFLGKSMGKMYWKEGERNKHDTVRFGAVRASGRRVSARATFSSIPKILVTNIRARHPWLLRSLT